MDVSISSRKGVANWRIAAGGRWQTIIKPKARCDQLSGKPGFSLSTNDDLLAADHIAMLFSIAIVFLVFSDGRGFTHARRLRTAFGFTGALFADGHIIPDQADYLFRCALLMQW